ncbi:hypothetical protein [Actinophytocola sp. NPDC049390]|uniref:hypothetical protein n=1 Tax=Actinophytocola sp. NPDC049390 TaxID=3363894 RepID=UPI00378A4640
MGDDTPIALLLHIRFTGLAAPEHGTARDEVTAEAIASLDRRGAEHLASDQFGKYAGALFFVDEHDRPYDAIRTHKLRRPSPLSPSNALSTARPSTS